MATTHNKYSTLYKINIALVMNGDKTLRIPSSDIVSLSIINNYDTSTFPIIRLRLYTDIANMEMISEYPNNIDIRCNMDGGVYRMAEDENTSPSILKPTKSISFGMKVYIEHKNTPTSTKDQYVDGIKKEDSLNENVKVPITLYCYDEHITHCLQQQSGSIYKNMSVTSVIESLLDDCNVKDYYIEPLKNQYKYDQILIPNLNIVDSLNYFDTWYGMYNKGGMMFVDFDKLYITNTDVNNSTDVLPIYIDSYKNNDDNGGLKRYNDGYVMSTKAVNASVISETDIERVLNSKYMVDVNVNNLDVNIKTLDELYDGSKLTDIKTTNVLHKKTNPYVSDMYKSRLNEKITRVHISGVGFDISKMKMNSRYSLIFESPIRGLKMNSFYRPTFTSHIITNMDADLFIAQTVMNLCNN